MKTKVERDYPGDKIKTKNLNSSNIKKEDRRDQYKKYIYGMIDLDLIKLFLKLTFREMYKLSTVSRGICIWICGRVIQIETLILWLEKKQIDWIL